MNINGPINYCCLKGKINGVEKKITLFMDKHYNLNEQTRCDTFNSIDISQYMYKEIKNTDEELDFFLEITTDEIKNKKTNKRDIYIKELFELCKSEFVIKKINDKDIVRYSKSNPNVRLHFLDIRDYMDIDKIRNIIKEKIKKNLNILLNSTDNNNKKIISGKILYYFENILKMVNKLTNEKNEFVKQHIKCKYENKQKYYINKSINKCNNLKLKENLIDFLENNYENVMYNLTIVMKNVKKVLEDIDNLNIDKIKKIYGYIEFIEEAIIDLYSFFVDCYLLRRILDKDYIKKSVIYTGVQHSIHYIYFLHKYYDFEITKIYHLEKNKNEMLEHIKNTNYVFEIYKYIITDKNYPQCIPYNPMFGGNPYLEYLKNKIGNNISGIKLF